jgi:integrase
MPTKPLPIYWESDRNRWRLYHPDGRKITLKRADGTPFAHCARYHPELLNTARTILEAAPQLKGTGPFAPDTFNAHARRYFKSAKFEMLAETTKRARRYAVEQFCSVHGDKRVTRFKRSSFRAMMDDLAGKPGAQRTLRTVINVLIEPAIEDGLIADPTAGFERPALSKTGWRDWPEELIEQYEAHFPKGHDARTALDLGLYTGQRKSDVVRMGKQHRKLGKIAVTQQKTGTSLKIPEHPALTESLDLVPKDRLTFLVTSRGAPFTAGGFGMHFAKLCREAGIPPGYSFHGLRKACCRRLAEAGCSAPEVMAISGHKSMTEVQRYIDAVNRERLGEQAIARTNLSPIADPAFPKEQKA